MTNSKLKSGEPQPTGYRARFTRGRSAGSDVLQRLAEDIGTRSEGVRILQTRALLQSDIELMHGARAQLHQGGGGGKLGGFASGPAGACQPPTPTLRSIIPTSCLH